MSIRKVSVIFSHWNTWRWTAIAVHFLKKYQWPVEWELLVANNSADHPSIKCLTETPLGDGVKIVRGEKDFPSHGRGNELCLRQISPESSHVFLSESDAFPIRDNWANEYIKAAADYDLIGPEIPQGSGRYIHPAGSLYDRRIFDKMSEWRDSIKDWLFCPDAGIELKNSAKPYHVVIHKDEFECRRPSDSLRERVKLWQRCENLQEMRSFQSDTFEDYMQRTGITAWEPPNKHVAINKIGYEAGQVAAYFAQTHGFRCLKAPTHIQWMSGWEGRQAAYSDVFGGFRHVWCGTSSYCNGIAPEVRSFKMATLDQWWQQVDPDIRAHIEKLEAEHA